MTLGLLFSIQTVKAQSCNLLSGNINLGGPGHANNFQDIVQVLCTGFPNILLHELSCCQPILALLHSSHSTKRNVLLTVESLRT